MSGMSAERLLVPAERSKLLWKSAISKQSAKISLFGLTIENTTVALASGAWISAARETRRLRVVFANAHVVTTMSALPDYYAIVASADRVYADGSGLAVAASLAGEPLIDNVNGTDIFPRLAADATTAGVGIFLLGGRPGIAEAARHRMVGFGLGNSIVGTHHGYFESSTEEDAAVAAANASGAAIVLVAMGVPRQDEWVARHAHRLEASVVVGVGGLFDFFAGAIDRAPHAMRRVGCEWVWRLALEPRRMAYRYLVGNLQFLALAIVEAIRIRLKKFRSERLRPVLDDVR